jgi:Family of unknown function (DUF5999)
MCEHQPRCPNAMAPDHVAARVVARHPQQGWSLLCNGVISFDDLGELLPNGRGRPFCVYPPFDHGPPEPEKLAATGNGAVVDDGRSRPLMRGLPAVGSRTPTASRRASIPGYAAS